MTTINLGVSADDIQWPDMDSRIEADIRALIAAEGNSLSNEVMAVMFARMGTGDVRNDRFTRLASGLDVNGEAVFADLAAIMQSTAHTAVKTHHRDGTPTAAALEYRRVVCLATSIAALLATLVPGIDDV